MIKIKVNNNFQSIESQTFLSDFIANLLSNQTNGVAVALNDEVVEKTAWSKVELKSNDNILIIKATQGG